MSTGLDATDLNPDAVFPFQTPVSSNISVSNGTGVELLESNTETLTIEPSSDQHRSGSMGVDSVYDARVSGDGRGTVTEYVEKVSEFDEIRVNDGGSETLTTEPSSDQHRSGIMGVDSVYDARVSGDGRGTVTEYVENVSEFDEIRVNDGGSDLVLNGEVSGSKITVTGVELLKSNTETLTMEPSSDQHRSGIMGVDSVYDARVSGDGGGTVTEYVEKVSEFDEIRVNDGGSETLTMEPSSDQHRSGIMGVDSVYDARVSGDGKGTVTEYVEKVSEFDEIRVNDGGSDLVLNGDVSGSKITGDENNGISLDRVVEGEFDREKEEESVSEEDVSQHSLGELNATNCAVDSSNHSGKDFDMGRLCDEQTVRDVELTEKDCEYKVSDLVWAKVNSYPWWPGQIFDPSASTRKAKKYFKKGKFLIAYFGDHTFAWVDGSKIKPFRKNFTEMEKQGNTKAFYHAVDCALDEASRRVEYGLACSCLSEEAWGKIKSQVVVSGGIRKAFRRISGGDSFSTVGSFNPTNIFPCVQDLAKNPFGDISRLEVLTVRSQLSAFNRWKGYYQLLGHQALDEPEIKLTDNSELPLTGKEKIAEDKKPTSLGEKSLSKKGKLNACDNISRKRQHVSGDPSASKKKRRPTNLRPNGSSSVPNGEKADKTGSKRKTLESKGSREETRSSSSDRKSSISSPKNLFGVGNSILKIAKQLSDSPLLLKKKS